MFDESYAEQFNDKSIEELRSLMELNVKVVRGLFQCETHGLGTPEEDKKRLGLIKLAEEQNALFSRLIAERESPPE